MDDDSRLARARAVLRAQQKAAAGGIANPTDLDPRASALALADEREASAVRDGPDGLVVGPFRYRRTQEVERWRRTRRVIARCDPGAHEDGNYLHLLARQAASIEMLFPDGEPAARVLDGVVLGTVGSTEPQATSRRVGDGSVVLLTGGLVYLVYQLSKAVVLAWQAQEEGARGPASFSTDHGSVERVLTRDPAAVEVLDGLLRRWLFEGVPRPRDSVAPAARYHPPLTVMINCAERFVIAHEYAHLLVDQHAVWTPPQLDPSLPPDWAKEIRADVLGMAMTRASAGDFDGYAPNLALQGPLVACWAFEIITQMRAWVGRPVAHTTHPPPMMRADALLATYQALPEVQQRPELDPRPALHASETVAALWRRVGPALESDVRSGARPLHRTWAGPG